jgi:hypothetical protein
MQYRCTKMNAPDFSDLPGLFINCVVEALRADADLFALGRLEAVSARWRDAVRHSRRTFPAGFPTLDDVCDYRYLESQCFVHPVGTVTLDVTKSRECDDGNPLSFMTFDGVPEVVSRAPPLWFCMRDVDAGPRAEAAKAAIAALLRGLYEPTSRTGRRALFRLVPAEPGGTRAEPLQGPVTHVVEAVCYFEPTTPTYAPTSP